jgi:hypothetical protein
MFKRVQRLSILCTRWWPNACLAPSVLCNLDKWCELLKEDDRQCLETYSSQVKSFMEEEYTSSDRVPTLEDLL